MSTSAPRWKSLLAALTFVALTAQAAENRVKRLVDPSRVALVTGQVHPLAQPKYDRGLADPAATLDYVTLYLRPDSSLQYFLAIQGRKWLTPEQFADRFGATQSDIDQVTAWLRSQGLKVNDVSRGRHWITFSGAAQQVGRALHTEIHQYMVNGKLHLANSTDVSIPEALEDVIAGFRGLDDFVPESMLVKAPDSATSGQPDFTSGSTHSLAPGDLATIYNITPLYNAGIDGTGQTIVIVGQSDILLSDIALFRSQFGLLPKVPVQMLVGSDPGTISDALIEADLDLEWAGAVARNAKLIYVYSSNAYTALQYAVDQNLGPVISVSFGSCELYQSSSFRSVAQQANAQGITVLASSGDSGAATCDRFNPTPQATTGATVSWPASFPEVTAVGGTELDDSSGNFWTTRNGANGGSAVSYIPETVWNDSVVAISLEGSGGGASVMFPKPAWQTGPGVPDDNARDLPDISLTSSPYRYPYRVVSQGGTFFVGGTSASSPSFAGMLALLNQYLVSQGTLATPGLGNINPTLYRLAQTAPSAFHDITAGTNAVPCVQSTNGCVNGEVGFDAVPGYDRATGLGSVDAFNLVTKWSIASESTTSVTATPSTAGPNDTVQLIATVKGSAGAAPAGTVSFVLSGVGDLSEVTLAEVTLADVDVDASGIATVTATGSQLSIGNGTIQAVYSGDSVYQGSAGSATVNINFGLSTSSAVVPFISPNPVMQDGEGIWPYQVALTERAGVPTTLTGFTVDGVTQNLSFWTSTKIPANGSVMANLTGAGLTAPLNRLFVFTGKDSSGQTWTQQISVPFLARTGTIVTPGMTLTTATPTVPRNPQADPSCQWSQQLTVQETGGFLMLLSSLTVNGVSFTSQIQSIFGTTRLAPYGQLQGNICYTNITPPATESVQVTALVDSGGLPSILTSTAISTLQAAAAVPVAFTSPAHGATMNLSVTGPVDPAVTVPFTAVPVSFTGGTPQWTASVGPSNRATNWLTVSPKSGTGSGTVMLSFSPAGLSPGAYTAVVSFSSPSAQPQVVNLVVTLTVGASSSMSIAAPSNNWSGVTTAAPGMIAQVYGTQLAPDGTSLVAPKLPLPLSLNGVSATVNGVAAPLYYVSPGQIDLQIPYETGAGTAVLAINNNGQVATLAFPVAATAPGLFSFPINNTTGQLVQSAKAGDVLLLFMTGEGDVTPTLATGATPALNATPSKYPVARMPVAVTVGGVPAQVLFGGIPNGLAGATQIDIVVPSGIPPGPQKVIVTVGTVAAPALDLNILAPGS